MQEVIDILKLNLEKVRIRMQEACKRANRDQKAVTLVAVTKSVGVSEARMLAKLGVTALGENRVQDALEKIKALSQEAWPLQWHLIGNLQTNKIKYTLGNFAILHAVDSLHLAEELNCQAEKHGSHIEALIEVNVSGEPSKHGLTPDALPIFLEKVLHLPEIQWRGLMTMAPFLEDPQRTRPFFAGLRELLNENARRFGISQTFRDLSMGMTNDFEVAIEEGATFVRVGTALFEGLPK